MQLKTFQDKKFLTKMQAFRDEKGLLRIRTKLVGSDEKDFRLPVILPASNTESVASSTASVSVFKQQTLTSCLTNIKSFGDNGVKRGQIHDSKGWLASEYCGKNRNYLMKVVVPLYKVPPRKTITHMIEDKYDILSTQIKNTSRSTISLTVDVWTDLHNSQSYLGLTGHCIHENKLMSIIFGVTALTEPLPPTHNADYLAKWRKYSYDSSSSSEEGSVNRGESRRLNTLTFTSRTIEATTTENSQAQNSNIDSTTPTGIRSGTFHRVRIYNRGMFRSQAQCWRPLARAHYIQRAAFPHLASNLRPTGRVHYYEGVPFQNQRPGLRPFARTMPPPFAPEGAIHLPFPPPGYRLCCRCKQYFNPELLPRVLFRADLNYCEGCRISS
ncbi:zinc finger BED domain-containing protein 1 [Trichonephila inaurata madagascariensis]|uniref:Zinc finger BED domain-containing protein 1 n=1 Tax=Trichonephila inaurata madagascariensis TaxID=2747483 RepID=A0A8X6MDR9_9ARAC|nr:zinc finger BED domain-containing protein 1 [Trichonephila inaurata madagascariensis]